MSREKVDIAYEDIAIEALHRTRRNKRSKLWTVSHQKPIELVVLVVLMPVVFSLHHAQAHD